MSRLKIYQRISDSEVGGRSPLEFYVEDGSGEETNLADYLEAIEILIGRVEALELEVKFLNGQDVGSRLSIIETKLHAMEIIK